MDTEMGETGEGSDVQIAQSDGCAKVNGDMNGAYTEKESPMDVTDDALALAIVDEDRPQKQRLVGGAKEKEKDEGANTNSQVPAPAPAIASNPDLDEHISSNGFNHDNENGDSSSMECDVIPAPASTPSDEQKQTADAKVVDDSVESSVASTANSDSVVANNKPLSSETVSSVSSEAEPSVVEESASAVVEEDEEKNKKKPDENGEEHPTSTTPDKPDVVDETEKQVEKDSSTVVDSSQSAKDVADVEQVEKSDPLASDAKAADSVENDAEGKSDEGSDDKNKSSSEVIDIDITPEKSKKPRKSVPINVTPRRSSRNLNKQKSYLEKDLEAADSAQHSDDPDIEEIEPQDPLAIDLAPDKKVAAAAKKTTIVVNDTKRLAEIAAGSKPSKGGKKEPTLVIIDTNSILSGRGPVPVSAHAHAHSSTTITASPMPGPSRTQQHQVSPSFSVLPVSLPPATLYSAQALRNQHTTIKPVMVSQQSPSATTLPQIVPTMPQQQPQPPQKPPVVLPSLTDDMYVVEAPSFIVPYVYEKPPIKPLKEYIDKLEQAIKTHKENEKKAAEQAEKLKREQDEKEAKEKEEKEAKEKEAKEKEEKEAKEKEEKEKEEKENKKEEGEEEKMDVDREDSTEKSKSTTPEEKMDVDEKKEEEETDKDKEATNKPKEDESSKCEAEKSDDKVIVEADEKPKDLSAKKDKEVEVMAVKEKEKEKEKESDEKEKEGGEKKKGGNTYFDLPLGKFFMQIGINLVQEHVQTDLLRSQKRKREREGSKCAPDVQVAINSLLKTLEFSKENNEPFKMELKKCEFCSFKTESQLAMAHHLETPHMRNYVYRCNFCTLEVRSPHDILFHMEAEHNVRGRLERAPAFHQCPSCPFEDNQKGKLTRHLLSCAKKYRPERNQEPPLDWEPPAKIPRVPRNRPPTSMAPGSALYQAAMTGLKQGGAALPQHAPSPSSPHPLLPKLMPPQPGVGVGVGSMMAGARGRGRPNLASRFMPDLRATNSSLVAHHKAMAAQMRPGMVYRPSGSNAQPQVLLPTSYQIAGNQIYQVVGHGGQGGGTMGGSHPLSHPHASNSNSITIQSSSSGTSGVGGGSGGGGSSNKPGQAAAAKLLQQPSISITPLPRPSSSSSSPSSHSSSPSQANPSASHSHSSSSSASSLSTHGKPGRPLGSGKATFVICEICDGYIKDLELLRNHMQWIHKVKIHPKMIYNRPPLNCQKCQFRFFTDQGLERHLLGSHGLVTSSMQEAANKGKDGGRCPVCGRVYQWKLLNHVARDHNMSLKPAHLSYKCTVCTATFGMYKQFENHVYSAHSVVAKRVMDKKPPNPSAASSSSSATSTSTSVSAQSSPAGSQSESLLKPLKINDEITIIPHPPRSKSKPGPTSRVGPSSAKGKV